MCKQKHDIEIQLQCKKRGPYTEYINTNILKCSFFSSGEQEAGIVISEGAAVCTDLLKKLKTHERNTKNWTISPNTFLEKRIQLQGLKIVFKIKPYI